MRTLAVLAGAVLLTACGGAPERECTLIGTMVGIGVQVDPEVADEFGATEPMEVCLQDACRSVPVHLNQATLAVDAGCTGQVCSANMRETGGKTGFAEVPDLPVGPVSVTFAGKTVTVTPKLRHPNGPGCDGGGPQAQLTVDARGVRASA